MAWFRMNTSELIRQLVRMCRPEDDAAFWYVSCLILHECNILYVVNSGLAGFNVTDHF